MTNYILKIKHILPAFLAVMLGTTAAFALTRWLLTIQFHLLDIKEEMWEIWAPIAIALIPVLIWLRPRYRALTFKKNEDNARFFFQVIAFCTLAAMLVLSQKYLTTATGKLETVTTVNDIDQQERGRYYRIENFDIATDLATLYPYISASGSRDQDLNIDFYFAVPVVDKDNSISNGAGWHYWYGMKFHHRISNSLSDDEKDEKYRELITTCSATLDTLDFHRLDHFENTPTSEEKKHFLAAIEEGTKQPPDEHCMVLQPISEPYEARNGNKLAWIIGSFGIGLAVLLLALLWPGYSADERERFQRGEKPDEDMLGDILRFLVPRGNHFVTSIILDLNILVFLLMVFSGVSPVSPDGEDLLAWGGNRRLETMGGEWWRLVTCTFVHAGILHLALNIYGLVIAAMFVEPILRRVRYTILYLISGICASLASIWWHENSVAIGASGAIFGVYGAIFGLLLTEAFPKNEKKQIFSFIGVYVFINLIWGISGGVDNAAHIGGLVSGALLGFILFQFGGNRKRSGSEQLQ